jgi:hypothetical protein
MTGRSRQAVRHRLPGRGLTSPQSEARAYGADPTDRTIHPPRLAFLRYVRSLPQTHMQSQ